MTSVKWGDDAWTQPASYSEAGCTFLYKQEIFLSSTLKFFFYRAAWSADAV